MKGYCPPCPGGYIGDGVYCVPNGQPVVLQSVRFDSVTGQSIQFTFDRGTNRAGVSARAGPLASTCTALLNYAANIALMGSGYRCVWTPNGRVFSIYFVANATIVPSNS